MAPQWPPGGPPVAPLHPELIKMMPEPQTRAFKPSGVGAMSGIGKKAPAIPGGREEKMSEAEGARPKLTKNAT